MKKNLRNFGAYLSLAGLIASCSTTSLNRIVADNEGFEPRTAYEAWGELNYAATSYAARALLVGGEAMDGYSSGVTWGAEKEASSQLIGRVMGPPASEFIEKVEALSEENRKAFLVDFLSNYVKDANGYRTYKNDAGIKVDLAIDVKDVEGNPKVIDLSELRGVDFESLSVTELSEKFKILMDQTDERPFSFLNPKVKSKIFKGNLPGLEKNLFAANSSWGNSNKPNYNTWQPNFGKAQKYLVNAHGHGGGQGGGWEINFAPLDTYGEFEEMVNWFRTELKQVISDPATLEKKVKLFQAPGHQRMVFKEHPELPKSKLSELYRMIQSYIVLKGIAGKTGIEFANYKSIHSDSTIESLRAGRGAIRLEGPRWASGTHGIEFRAGTKDINTARFYQTVLAARVSSNDFEGLSDISDYSLYSGFQTTSSSAVAERINIEEAKVSEAQNVLNSVGIKESYTVQFWNWAGDDVTFISKGKKELIKSVTRDYINAVAALSSEENIEKRKELVRALNQEWVLQTRLTNSIEEYIRPRKNFNPDMESLEFRAEGRPLIANPVDVNNIDLGIEFSGKFPLMVRGDFSRERLGDNKRAWLQTRGDLTEEERKQIIKNVATSLKENLGSEADVTEIDADGHGHGLDVAFSIRDSQDRKWIIEWDGIGRTYDDNGEILENSARGGSIELVTPKFVPKTEEIQAVYKAFEENDILPNLQGGGGHINVDLAAFEGKPKELARFLSIFHEHRSVISLMFQHVNRVRTSEPIEVSDNLSEKLKNFEGSEEDLKKLLYEERYFNTRFGRKTRYLQIDMSAYFQDVIPEEFITEDFDIASPTVPWRRQFRVDPNIRKMEFRMFNAPRDTMESGLQIKLVRAMLSKALNESDELSGEVQNISHLKYLEEPEKAMTDLEKMCDDLGLDVNEFRPQVAEGLAETDKASKSIFFQTFEEKMVIHPFQRGWGDAVSPRSSENALSSEGREWTPGPADELNTMTNEHRVQAAREAMRQRQSITPAREIPGEFVRTENCADLLGDIL